MQVSGAVRPFTDLDCLSDILSPVRIQDPLEHISVVSTDPPNLSSLLDSSRHLYSCVLLPSYSVTHHTSLPLIKRVLFG